MLLLLLDNIPKLLALALHVFQRPPMMVLTGLVDKEGVLERLDSMPPVNTKEEGPVTMVADC